MINLTPKERILLSLIATDEYNAVNGDWDHDKVPAQSDLITWTNVKAWAREIDPKGPVDPAIVKGVLSSLIKKGLIECEGESRPGENDETTYFTDLGYETIIELRKPQSMKEIEMKKTETTQTTQAAVIPTKKEMVKEEILTSLSAAKMAMDQTWIINNCGADIAGPTTIKNAIKELEKSGSIKKTIINKLICWEICLPEPTVSLPEPEVAKTLEDVPAEFIPNSTPETEAEKEMDTYIENAPEIVEPGAPTIIEEKPSLKDTLKKSIKVKVKAEKTTKTKQPKEKGPGIIETIITILKSPKMRKEIIEELSKAFPDKDPGKMAKTVQVQVPYRLKKDKGLNVVKDGDKFQIK